MAPLGRRLDPLNFLGFLTESLVLCYMGDFEAALPLAERPIELDPQFREGYHIAGYVLIGLKKYDRAVETLTRAVATSHRGAWPIAKLGVALIGLGGEAEARVLLWHKLRHEPEFQMLFAPRWTRGVMNETTRRICVNRALRR